MFHRVVSVFSVFFILFTLASATVVARANNSSSPAGSSVCSSGSPQCCQKAVEVRVFSNPFGYFLLLKSTTRHLVRVASAAFSVFWVSISEISLVSLAVSIYSSLSGAASQIPPPSSMRSHHCRSRRQLLQLSSCLLRQQ